MSDHLQSNQNPIDVSIVIPCYCSSAWLNDLVLQIGQVLSTQDLSYEILLINDASPDSTWETIQFAARSADNICGYDLQFNVGQFRTTICGLEHARGNIVVTIDDDFQYLPADIPVLLKPLFSDPAVDCVIGKYRSKKEHNLIRNLGSRFMGQLGSYMYGKPVDLQLSSFRAMRKEVAAAICAHRTSKPIIGPLLLQSTKRIINVTVSHQPRKAGRTGYSLARLVRITFDNIISGTTLPLKILSLLGFIAALISFLLGTGYLVRYLTGGIGVPGFATLVLLVIFFGGTTLFSVGLLGEYIIRIIQEVAHPPRYLVRGTTEHSAEASLKSECDHKEMVQPAAHLDREGNGHSHNLSNQTNE